jgi:acyl-coenzyme A thioesterase PaaI-like protein
MQASEPDPFDRLGAALRALSDVVIRSGATPEDVNGAAAQIEALSEQLSLAPAHSRLHDSPFHPMSLVGGSAHPAAPQLHMTPTEAGVAGTVTLGPTYEGGPGLVHGGVLSLLFDHAMGQALFVAGHHAMTVSLEVRFRAPTPLDVPLAVTAGVDRIEGRKRFVSARVTVTGTVTAEAHAVFVALNAANVAQIFPPGRVPQDDP